MNPKSSIAIRTDLNLTGVFLQKIIYDSLLKKHGFGARREEPYSFRTAYGEHFNGTADILAAFNIEEYGNLTLSIECKRADKQQKHWVFETRDLTAHEPLYPFRFYTPGPGINYSKKFHLPSLGYNRDEDFDKAIQSFEFRDQLKEERVLSQNSNNNVYKALLQAFEPISSFIFNAQASYDLTGFRNMEILYIPIVVTSANLSVMSYDPKDIDIESGTIEVDKLTLIEKKWVHYELPLPESLRREGRFNIDKVETENPVKSPVFIVNSTAFDEFVEGLKKDLKTHVMRRS